MGRYKKSLDQINKQLSSYDSDEDLDKETRKALSKTDSPYKREQLRKEGWKKAGMFKKLKRAIKDGWAGDIHKKEEEVEDILKK